MGTIILVVVVILIVGTFSVQNAAPVSISFLSSHFDASLAVIALLFFLAGMIAGMAVLSWVRVRRSARKKNEQDQKRSKSERPL
ncbi:MAG: LapA family protein [Nitrospirota bacterium]|mgnify:CR=1 FL=1